MAILKDYKVNTGRFNMDEDANLLDYAVENNLNEPILRLYGWCPACISLGRNQDDFSVNNLYCSKNNIDIVRRLTGGRALLHNKELTYSFICNFDYLENGNSVIESYKEISGALIKSLSLLNIELAFPNNKKHSSKTRYCMSLSTGADLSYQNKKLIGSAQFRKQNYILQHGSILMDYDKNLLESIFNERIDEDNITSLHSINSSITIEKLREALIEGFSSYFNIKFRLYF